MSRTNAAFGTIDKPMERIAAKAPHGRDLLYYKDY